MSADTKRRQALSGYQRTANRCANCVHFKPAEVAHSSMTCIRGLFPTNRDSICTFHKRKERLEE